MLAINRTQGYKIFTRALVLLWLVAACWQPAAVLAAGADPAAAKNKHAKISMMDIAVFYAGMVGIVVGVATGWVSLLVKSSASQAAPGAGNQNK